MTKREELEEQIARAQADVKRLHDELVGQPTVPYRTNADEAGIIERYGLARQKLTQLKYRLEDLPNEEDGEPAPAWFWPVFIGLWVVGIVAALAR
jgi:hypothetical protein